MTKFLILSVLVTAAVAQYCNQRVTDEGSVCVCNATYCDTVPELSVPSDGFQVYVTIKANLGLYSYVGTFGTGDVNDKLLIAVDQNVTHQSIIGFGGAFTDSTGINLRSLSQDAQDKLMESYFGSSGIEYSLCRVPIGGTDFSTRGYSYDDVDGDDTLEHFALQQDDFDYKIPYIHQANALRGSPVTLFSSPWTAPKWMKTNNDWSGIGFLKNEYYQLWVDYFVRFFEEYEKNNITFWGTTLQNEPEDGFFPKFFSRINSMGWTPTNMISWINENFGPTIRNSKYKDLKIMLHDDNRLTFPLLQLLLKNEETLSYADGVGVHWYTDFLIPASSLKQVKTDKKGWFFISSEACNGYLTGLGLDKAVRKGSWTRGENYIKSIFDILEAGGSGWVDWNMALDETGGPTYIDNFVDSPVLVSDALQEFYKQPMFYALGHFSKFIVPGSVMLDTKVPSGFKDVRAMGFLRPDGLTALVIFNMDDDSVAVQIQAETGKTADLNIAARSINTVLYI